MFSVGTAYAAVVTVATGTLTDSHGDPAMGVTVSIHNGNGSISSSDVTDESGEFELQLDEDIADGESLTIEFVAPTGYIESANGSYHFNYSKGDAPVTAELQMIAATKAIHATVTTIDGTPVENADIIAVPIQAEIQSQEGGNITNGEGTIYVTGGTWAVSANRNLSEQNPERYPWVPISPAAEVEFSLDETEETVNVAFTVVSSQQLVQIQPLDSEGNSLTQNSFNGDISFEGYTEFGVVNTHAKVNGETGIAQLYLLPGIYKVNAYHQQLADQSYDPSVTFVVGEEPGTYDWGTFQAEANSATLSGTVTLTDISQTSAKLITTSADNIPIIATNLDNGRTFQATTNENGYFLIDRVAVGSYSIDIDSDQYISTSTAFASVSAQQVVSDLDIVARRANMVIQGSIVNTQGTPVEHIAGAVVGTLADRSFSAPVESDGTYSLTLYGTVGSTVELSLVTQKGATVFMEDAVKVTTTADTTNYTITVQTNEGTIEGRVVNSETGAQLTSEELGDNAVIVALQLDNGSVEEANIEHDGTFSLSVGSGTWKLVTKISDSSSLALSALVGDEQVPVIAGESVTDIEVAVVMTSNNQVVTGTVLDAQGELVPEARIAFTNLPALEAQAAALGTTVDPENIISLVTKTNAAGEFNQPIPNGTFTGYIGDNPNGGNDIAPEITEFSVDGVSVDLGELQFRSADSTISGTVDENLHSAQIIFYSQEGGRKEATVTDGAYSIGLTVGTWEAVVSGVNAADELAVQVIQLIVDETKETLNFTNLQSTGVSVPAAAQKVCDVTESCIVSNDAGAQVFFAPYSAGFDGQVTVQLAPIPNIEVGSGGFAQVGLSYDVSIWDGDGMAVSQLERPAQITLPIDDALLYSGVDAKELTPTFIQEELNLFLTDGVVGTVNNNSMVLQTTHLSRFAISTVTEQGELTFITKPTKPRSLKAKKVTKTSALLTWKKPKGDTTVTKYNVQLRKYKIKKQKKWKKYTHVQLKKKSVKKLSSATRYQFRVKACNTAGCSAFTKWKAFKTKK
ncbi:MAG TPA: fibronectin type III domain-containing protein [Patescibacteria group bacterium]|nr:fibronectin type III domain-containing protein [Patescibacteria group bacterium]